MSIEPKPKPDLDHNDRARTATQTRKPEAPHASYQPPYDYEMVSAKPAREHLSADKERALITYNHLTYFLNIISYFTAGLLWVVPIAMNYGKRHDADGTWLATHFDWQIKTFWYSIVFFVIGIVIILFALGGFGISMLSDSSNIAIGSILLSGIGLMIIVFTLLWHLYRIVRGWIALSDKRPVP